MKNGFLFMAITAMIMLCAFNCSNSVISEDKKDDDSGETGGGDKAWHYAPVDLTGNVGKFSSIAIDGNNKMHISYGEYNSATQDYSLKYANNVNGTWVCTTVDNVDDNGEYTSIAIDKNNKVHISYKGETNDGEDGALKYATNKSGTWSFEVLDSNIDDYFGRYTTVAVDINCYAHISYYDTNNSRVKYATNKSGAWICETIDPTVRVLSNNSLALDSNGKVYICYIDCDNDLLKYATNLNGSWEYNQIAAETDSGGSLSMAIDGNNKIHVSCISYTVTLSGVIGTGYGIKYGTNSSGAFTYEIIDTSDWSNGYVAMFGNFTYNSLKLDTNNKVYIIYKYTLPDYDIRLLTNADGTWKEINADISSTVFDPEYLSLAIDSNKDVNFSFFDTRNDDLYYANYK